MYRYTRRTTRRRRRDVVTIIRDAIAQQRLLEFTYDGFHRVVEPYLLGSHKGRLQLLCYQVRGQSASGKIPEWRRMNVGEIAALKILEESFDGQRPTKGVTRSPFDLKLAIPVAATRRPRTIYLVSCVGKKRQRAEAAKELYHSPWFRAARAY